MLTSVSRRGAPRRSAEPPDKHWMPEQTARAVGSLCRRARRVPVRTTPDQLRRAPACVQVGRRRWRSAPGMRRARADVQIPRLPGLLQACVGSVAVAPIMCLKLARISSRRAVGSIQTGNREGGCPRSGADDVECRRRVAADRGATNRQAERLAARQEAAGKMPDVASAIPAAGSGRLGTQSSGAFPERRIGTSQRRCGWRDGGKDLRHPSTIVSHKQVGILASFFRTSN
jgi:hypothetical protein